VSRGSFIPKILSPAEAKEQLAVPCLLILAGVAEPVFPNRDRSTPSPTVLIMGTKVPGVFWAGLPTSMLPVPVEWRQWKTAVVPVLEDERWRVRNPLNAALIRTGETVQLVEGIGLALSASFAEAGWGPQG
jgi:hypothetical protein